MQLVQVYRRQREPRALKVLALPRELRLGRRNVKSNKHSVSTLIRAAFNIISSNLHGGPER